MAGRRYFTDNFPPEDLYRRRSFARHLGDLLCHTPESENFCVALIAPWGNGKTTALGYLREELQDNEKIRFCDFQPFIYHDSESLVSTLHRKITEAVGKGDKKTARKLAVTLRAFEVATHGGSYAVRALSFLFPPLLLIAPWMDRSGKLLGKLANFLRGQADKIKPPEQLLSDAQNIMRNSGVRVVVFIDEVDRLTPVEIQLLFRVIRMAANFPNVTHVAAFDRTIVVDALSQLYSGAEDPKGPASRYLEKIFQLEVPLPFPDRAWMRSRVIDGINELLERHDATLSDEDSIRFIEAFDGGLLEGFRNLRVSNRFWNQLEFFLPMVIGNVNLGDFLILEAVRACDPQGYDAIKRDGLKLVAQQEESIGTLWAQAGIDSTEWTKRQNEAAQQLAEKIAIPNSRRVLNLLFPFLEAKPSARATERAALQLRLWLPRFAYRHFNYAVASDDIPSTDARDVVLAVKNGADVTDRIEKLLDGSPLRAEKLVEEFSSYVDGLTPESAANLAIALSKIFPRLPRPASIFFDGTLHHACRVCANLIRQSPYENWKDLIRRAIATDQLGGAYLLRLFEVFEDTRDIDKRLKEADFREVATEFANRIEAEDAQTPITSTTPRTQILHIYRYIRNFGDAAAFKARLHERIGSDLTYRRQFFLLFVGTTTTEGSTFPSDFGRRNFIALSSYVDSSVVHQAITQGARALIGTEYPDTRLSKFPALSNQDGSMQEMQFVWLFENPDGVGDA